MSMRDPQYHPLFDQATNMQYQFHDATKGASASLPQTRSMKNEIHQLVQDIAVERSPKTIETRIKAIQHQISSDKRMPTPVLPWDSHDELHYGFETMRNTVRNFSNY